MLSNIAEVFILDSIRTPIGCFRGALSGFTAPQLGSLAIKALLSRNEAFSDKIEEVFMGNVCSAGIGQSPARQASLGAGLSNEIDCTTINKVCASGMKSIMLASQSIALGYRKVMLAGGMESMSNVPFYLTRGELPYGGTKLIDGIVCDGLTDAYNHIHMGLCGEKLAKYMSISREHQDEFARNSYERANNAIKSGVFDSELTPVTIVGKRGKPDTVITTDEEPLKGGDSSKFAKLKPAFDKAGGTITAANASKLNDGACALLLGNQSCLSSHGDIKNAARIIAYSDAATNPVDFTIAPSIAIPMLLKMVNLSEDSIDMWEINEAFSVVALGNIQKLRLDPAKVNVNGGAVAMGHPIGMSGARIVGHLFHQLRNGQKGIAAICNGGGAASAILIEKL